jgi:hypothetical protein
MGEEFQVPSSKFQVSSFKFQVKIVELEWLLLCKYRENDAGLQFLKLGIWNL